MSRRKPLALVDTARQGYAVLDRELAALRGQAEQQGHQIPCRQGCSACCFLPASLTLLDVWVLVRFLRTWSGDERRRLHRLVDDARERRRAAGLPEVVIEPEEARGPWLNAYQRLAIACPLLRGGSCAVYQRRPPSCRGHHVVDTDPGVCADPDRHDETAWLDQGKAVQAHVDFLAARMGGAPLAALTVTTLVEGLYLARVPIEDERVNLEQWVETVRGETWPRLVQRDASSPAVARGAPS